MKTKPWTTLLMVILVVGSLNAPARSVLQSSARDDSLKPFTSCELHDGLKIVQVDRLPNDVKTRTVKTSNGDRKISLADGYRVMVAYNDDRDWFVNIKAEKSVAAEYERDKQSAIDNLKWALSISKEMDSTEPVKVSFGAYEGYGISRRTLLGNVVGIYVLFSDADRTITTFYFINQNAKKKRFQTIEEWHAVRDEFLKTYSACAKSERSV